MKSPRTPIDPSRNFCTMGACYVDADPLDRKEKLALVNYVAGGIGALLLILCIAVGLSVTLLMVKGSLL